MKNLAAFIKQNFSPAELAALKAKYRQGGGYEQYQHDPLGFVQKELHCSYWSKQAEILEALAQPRARVSARSCHGIGKTAVSSFAALWFLYSFRPSRVVVTATKQDQLKSGVFYEVNRFHERAGLPGECGVLSLKPTSEQLLVGQTARSATSFQGQHAPSVLVIVDEAAGVSEETFIGVDALLTNEDARLLLLGNPTSSSGRFYDSHHSLRHLYKTIHVSAFDTPNWTQEQVPEIIRKSLINPAWVREKAEEWGVDSPFYKSRILGEFPAQSEDALISLVWIESAKELQEADEDAVVEFGVDVARHGNCETVVYARRGRNVILCEAWQGADITTSSGRIVRLAQQHKPKVIRIDDGGVGGGLVDVLREALQGQGITLQAINAGSASTKPDFFVRLRDQVWWHLREKLRTGAIGGLTDERTKAQLAAIKYANDSRGRIKVEGKPDLEKRGLKSPDRADALCLCFFDAVAKHAAAPIDPAPSNPDWFSDRDISPW